MMGDPFFSLCKWSFNNDTELFRVSFQATSQALEAEIKELEQQIDRERAGLEALQAEQRVAVSFKSEMNENLLLSEEIKDSRGSAEILQTKFMSLKGMHSWSPVVIDESEIVVAFIGASPKTCVKLSYSFTKSGAIACHANVDPTFFRQHRGKQLKLTPATSAFVDANVESFLESASNSKLACGGDIGKSLQHLEMMHGRLEMTANELFVLQKRYNTIMEADPVGKRSDFLLSVDFRSLRGSTTLRATFELTTSYPFAPLNVSLDVIDGKVEVDSLRRQLIKNAKPGFGYLSRTCDTISAFLR